MHLKIKPVLWIITVVALSGCASLPRVSSEQYPRIGVIALFYDRVQVSEASSFFALPKGYAVELPGLSEGLRSALVAGLESGGHTVTVLPVSADEFWQAFDATAQTKEGTSWHLGVWKNARLTVQSLESSGRINLTNLDAVLVVGPNEFYYDSNFLSKDGTLVTLFTLGTKPGELGGMFSLNAIAINARTKEGAGGGKAAGPLRLGRVRKTDDLTSLDPGERREIAERIRAEASGVVSKLVADLK